MKKLLKIIFVVMTIFVSSSIAETEAPVYEAQLMPFFIDDNLFVDINIRSLVPNAIKLGSLTFAFSFNSQALQYVGKEAEYDGPWDDSNPEYPGWYIDAFATKPPSLDLVSINIGRSPTAPAEGGLLIPLTSTRLGRIKFVILDPMLPRNIEWSTIVSSVYDWSTYIDLKDDFVFSPVGTEVPVELSSFACNSFDGTVSLDWVTSSETNNLGFYIYRSESENGPYLRMSTKMISGLGNSAEGQAYKQEDIQVEVGKVYFYKLGEIDFTGQIRLHGPVSVTVASPQHYGIAQNYPNPFNPVTNIDFKLKESGFVDLTIYNLRGQVVKQLIQKELNAGKHSVVWDAHDQSGLPVPTGVYFYRLQVNDFQKTIKMQFVK